MAHLMSEKNLTPQLRCKIVAGRSGKEVAGRGVADSSKAKARWQRRAWGDSRRAFALDSSWQCGNG